MNIVADNHCNYELIGGQVWWGKICDTLAENYLNTESRYLMIQMLDGFVQDAMSFKPLDRSVVRTKDLMLDDGQAYDQYYDPFILAANNMMKDIDTCSSTASCITSRQIASPCTWSYRKSPTF